MNISDLDFSYPADLVATERRKPSRVMHVNGATPRELESLDQLIELFRPGDCLVINETRVLKRRVFSESGLEILFLKTLNAEKTRWEVLCPSSRWKSGTTQTLPGGVELQIIERARIQVVDSDNSLTHDYFEKYGDLPLPPYIQKARGERRNRPEDIAQYQTAWAKADETKETPSERVSPAGSLAAPTASFHFDLGTLSKLQVRGVSIGKITLHVGLGTFLPITVETLEEHKMHAESVEIPAAVWDQLLSSKAKGGRVWALGTTVIRSLESAALGLLPKTADGFEGETDIFIRPGFEFKIVDCILTNFHQPRSTLIALVAAFAGLENVKAAYAWAIEKKFRLFSYGDLTVWTK